MSSENLNEPSYESTGAAGTDFEADTAAGLLVRVLSQTGDRILPPAAAATTIFLQRRSGLPAFDDITVEGTLPDGTTTTTFIQARRKFSLTAPSGPFVDFVREIWARDLRDQNARWAAAIVTAKPTSAARDVQWVTAAALASVSASDFEERCQASGALNAGKRSLLSTVAAALPGEPPDSKWRVLRRLLLIDSDYDQTASRDRLASIELLRNQVADGSLHQAENLWSTLRSLALRDAKLSPSFDRASLIAILRDRYTFRTLLAHEDAIQRIRAEASLGLATIRTDVAGVTLIRPEIHTRAVAMLEASCVLKISGEGGTGKSALLRRICSSAQTTAVLLLKDDRVSGRTWQEYAEGMGIHLSAQDLVRELAAGGQCLLAIDGADRMLLSERRAVVVDLLREVGRSPLRSAWRVAASARDFHGRDLVDEVLDDAGFHVSGTLLSVGQIDDKDARILAIIFPHIAHILTNRDYSSRNRDLFTIRELLELPRPDAALTEVDLAAMWASRGQRSTPPDPHRDVALAQIGGVLATGARTIGQASVNPSGVISLLRESALRLDERRDALLLTHDIYEDWILARELDRQRTALPDLLATADQPLWWMKSVRLAGQIALEGPGGITEWRALFERCSHRDELDPAWARSVLAGIFYSERYASLLGSLEPILLENDGRLLEQLVDTLMVLETQSGESLFADVGLEDVPHSVRKRLAASLRLPRAPAWPRFLRWSISRWIAWPPRLIPKLAEVALIWLRNTEGAYGPLSERVMNAVHKLLIEIEDAEHSENWEDRRPAFGYEQFRSQDLSECETTLRSALIHGTASGLNQVRAYLLRLGKEKRLWKAADEILQGPRSIVRHLPAEYVDLAIAHFVPRRRRARRDDGLKVRQDPVAWWDVHGIQNDHGYFPASPLRGGFSALFEASETDALRLFHALERRAAVTWRAAARWREGRTPRPVRLTLPWGSVALWGDENVYRWARGILGSHVLGCLYLALGEWISRSVKDGRRLEEVLRLVLQPYGLVATLVPCITAAVENVNRVGEIDAINQIVAEPRLWNYEVRRYQDDLTHSLTVRIGFWHPKDPHLEAALKCAERYRKRTHIRTDLVLPFHVLAGDHAKSHFYSRASNWNAADLASYEDELEDPQLVEQFQAQIERYKIDADPQRVRIAETSDPGKLAVSIEAPADVVAAEEEQRKAYNAHGNASALMVWAAKSIEHGRLEEHFSIGAALELARAWFVDNSFRSHSLNDIVEYVRGQAVAGVAAVAAGFAEEKDLQSNLSWISDVLKAAAGVRRAEEGLHVDEAAMSSDPQVFAAAGLAALARRGYLSGNDKKYLLELAVDRHHEVVSTLLANLDARRNPLLAWVAFRASSEMCLFDLRSVWMNDLPRRVKDRRRRQRRAIRSALSDLRKQRYTPPPVPPRPYKMQWLFQRSWRTPFRRLIMPSRTSFNWSRSEAILRRLPIAAFATNNTTASPLVAYLLGVVGWMRAHTEDAPDRLSHLAHFPFEFAGTLAKALGCAAYHLRDEHLGLGLHVSFKDFKTRERALELMGDFLEGVVGELINAGVPPDEGFWRVWEPASEAIISHPDNSARDGRITEFELQGPVAVAGFVGPLLSPLPPDWPHLPSVLPSVDRWAQKTAGSPFAANALLRFCERFSTNQIEQWALPWVERLLQLHRSRPAFWSAGDNGERAAALLENLPLTSPELRRRVRSVLALLADLGSLTARESLIRFGSRPASA